MKLIIIVAVFAFSSAAQLPSRNYIPPSQGGQESAGHPEHGTGIHGDTGNRRPQQDAEKNSAILKQEQEITENGDYHFGYETSSGIRAEESGSTSQSQGGFSYKGDDGNTYTVIYSSGEGGFRPQGEHLPVPPPTPQEILLALQQNEKDEAAGIFDDGQYHPEANSESKGTPGQSGGFVPSPGQSGSESHQNGFNSNTGYHY